MTVSSPKASAIGPNLLVHAYVDGELDAASALDLKQQIDADPAMAAEAANISALQGVLRSKLTPEQVPPGLRSRIEEGFGAICIDQACCRLVPMARQADMGRACRLDYHRCPGLQ